MKIDQGPFFSRHMLIYSVIGALCASLDYLIFFCSLELLGKENYVAAHTIGYMTGTGVSFYANAKFNFKVANNYISRIITFFSVATSGLIISMIFIYFLTGIVGLPAIVSKAVSMILILFFQFYINRSKTFRV
jgi:putative flippase GtrA